MTTTGYILIGARLVSTNGAKIVSAFSQLYCLSGLILRQIAAKAWNIPERIYSNGNDTDF
jgi:hypothetical protein